VILKEDGVDIELGSIGVQHEGWVWGFDSVIPMRELETEGNGKDRRGTGSAVQRGPGSTERISRHEAEAAAMIKRAPIELPPEVARRFFESISRAPGPYRSAAESLRASLFASACANACSARDQWCDDAQASIPTRDGGSFWKKVRTCRRLN
jgi:hypothetical protein